MTEQEIKLQELELVVFRNPTSLQNTINENFKNASNLIRCDSPDAFSEEFFTFSDEVNDYTLWFAETSHGRIVIVETYAEEHGGLK